jgi:hypothetical protein
MKIGLGIGLGYSKESGSSVPAAPANVVLPSLIGSGAVGTVVTCNRGSWSGSPSPTYTFNFLVDSISVQNTASNTYTPLSGDDTKTLTCVVTATNPLGTASATTSNSLVVGTVPVNTVAPDITPFDNQVIGTSLSATSGTWDGTPTLTFAYRWTRNNVPISGATSSTYTLQAADELQTIRVEVRATNDYATSSFVVSSNNAVGGYVPLNVSQPSMSLTGNQLVGTLVTVTNGTWSGSSPITFEYRWLRNGSPIGGATSSSYTLQSADDGNVVTAQVRALNAFGTSAYSTSDNSINAGTVPVNTVAPTVSPSGTQSTGTLITADVESWDGTAPITFEYKWTRDGVAISGATASTYTIQLADDGTTIRVEVKGTNAYGTSGFVASSNSVSAVNVIAPVNTSAPVVSGTAVVSQVLTTTNGAWDNSPTSFSYQWKRGVTNVGTNASTYTLVSADAGQSITCVVTATNAGGSANATSNALSILATLLDIYPNAAAAYSVRLLRGAYYGSPAIRVRRSNDNAEQNIGFTTSGDLDTSALTTFVGANSGFIVTWFDQSGNGINGNQTTPSSQHQIVNAGAIIEISSKPTTDTLVRFPLTLTANVIFTHAVSVAKIDTLSGANYLCFGATIKGLFYGGTTPSITGLGGFDGTVIRSATVENLNRAIGWFSLRSGSLFVQRDNGSEDNLGTFAGPMSINTISGRALATTEFRGKVQEQIYYNSDISANRAGIINNVNTYYGIF